MVRSSEAHCFPEKMLIAGLSQRLSSEGRCGLSIPAAWLLSSLCESGLSQGPAGRQGVRYV